MNNIKSVALIFVLIAIALFLAGFRLGRQVERIDKNYVPRPTTTPIVPTIQETTPTQVTTRFKTLTHSMCGISFLYPDSLVQVINGSNSGQLKKDSSFVGFTCLPKLATPEATLLTPTISIINGLKITSYSPTKQTTKWSISKNSTRILFETSSNLTDLVMRTVSFINK